MVGSEWLILQLNDISDTLGYKEIEVAIKAVFGDDAEYFIPIHYEPMGSYVSTCCLVEGYAFVRDSFSVRSNIMYINDQRLFTGVLHKKGKYETVNSHIIAGMKKKLRNSLKRKFILTDKVRILEGVFKNLVGEVVGIEDAGKKIFIKITRISREMIVPIPSTLLEHYSDRSNKDED